MRRMLATMLQALIDAEATADVPAERHERTENRTTQRNGTRDKVVATTAGDLTSLGARPGFQRLLQTDASSARLTDTLRWQ